MTNEILSIFGGLGLFIYGMVLLSEGLQKAAGRKLRKILSKFTGNRVFGLITGTIVTAAIQSSSATTVMVLGFINSKILTLSASIPLILGANIGTTVTAQIISFKLDSFALPAIAIGVIFKVFLNKKSFKDFGTFLIGFGLLFLGMTIMKNHTGFIKEQEFISTLFATSGDSISGKLILLLSAALITAIVQSSSVTTGIIITLSMQGIINGLDSAIPLLAGAHVGTCITAILASFGAGKEAKRAALIHLIFNTLAAILAILLIPFYINIVRKITVSNLIWREIANAHMVISIIPAILFLPFSGLLEKLSRKVIKGDDTETSETTDFVKNSLLSTPAFALEEVTSRISTLTEKVNLSIDYSFDVIRNYTDKRIEETKLICNDAQKQIYTLRSFLTSMIEGNPGSSEIAEYAIFIHTLHHLKRINIHTLKILDGVSDIHTKKLEVDRKSFIALAGLYDAVSRTGKPLLKSFKTTDAVFAEEALRKKEDVDNRKILFREGHMMRLKAGGTDIKIELILTGIAVHYEKIGDHLEGIANEIINDLSWDNNKSKQNRLNEINI